jgi:hypothetical protein
MKNDINHKWKKMPWYHPFSLNHFLNPLVTIQDLFYGIRMPKSIYFTGKYNKKAGWSKEKMVNCEKCNTFHNDLTWSYHNDTKMFNWFGLYCPNCGELIPARRNLFSLIILAILFPIRYLFNKSLKTKWLEKQPARFEKITFDNSKPIQATKYFWMMDIWYQALILYWVMSFSGIFMNEPFVYHTPKGILFLFIFAAIGALIYQQVAIRSWKKEKEKTLNKSEIA